MLNNLNHGPRFAALLLLLPALVFVVAVLAHRAGPGTDPDLLLLRPNSFDRSECKPCYTLPLPALSVPFPVPSASERGGNYSGARKHQSDRLAMHFPVPRPAASATVDGYTRPASV